MPEAFVVQVSLTPAKGVFELFWGSREKWLTCSKCRVFQCFRLFLETLSNGALLL
jgi:hypothetical protein